MDVVVIGAGAAGLAAACRLRAAKVPVRVIEAHARLGGRAYTATAGDFPLDLGCGWLHSADENEWSAIAQDLGFTLDKTPPPWNRHGGNLGWPREDEQDFRSAIGRFYARLEAASHAPDRAAVDLLEPNGRWNGLLGAMSTWINGAELELESTHDWNRYRDSGVNWRVAQGYGALIAAYGEKLDVTLACQATRIDHSGRCIHIDTSRGTIDAGAVIVTTPTETIAREDLRFAPALPAKCEAAQNLPLGLADKLFLQLDDPDDFAAETRVFGATDTVRTGSYHLKPFGRPLIEAYFGGTLARDLEAEGDAAFAAFAIEQLAGHFGSGIRKRLHPVAVSSWGRDPFARGSYSYAKPGYSEARAALAAPVDERLFFAGEACSTYDFSTAHGAFRSGVAAAEQVLRAAGNAYSPGLRAVPPMAAR